MEHGTFLITRVCLGGNNTVLYSRPHASFHAVPEPRHADQGLEEIIVTAQKRDRWDRAEVVVAAWKRARRERNAVYEVAQALQELSRQPKFGILTFTASGTGATHTDDIILRLASELASVTRLLELATVLLRRHLRCIRSIERQLAGTKFHQTLLHMLSRRVRFRRRVHGLKPGIISAALSHGAVSRYECTHAMSLGRRITTPQSLSHYQKLGMNIGSSLLAEAATCA